MKLLKVSALAVTAAVALSACGGGRNGGPVSPARPSTKAKLSILEPRNGQVIHGSTVHLSLRLVGARIVIPTTTHIVPTQGHIHVYLDNRIVSMNYRPTGVIRNVKPGNHLLQAEFVASDHLPWNPRVIQAVTFEVKR